MSSPCILCNTAAIPGLKYCPRHYAIAQGQTLADKLAEQRAANEGRKLRIIDRAMREWEVQS